MYLLDMFYYVTIATISLFNSTSVKIHRVELTFENATWITNLVFVASLLVCLSSQRRTTTVAANHNDIVENG
jgi:hypothetical protein